MTKTQKILTELNAEYRNDLKLDFEKKFRVEITTGFSLFADSIYSSRLDKKDFTQEQKDYILAYEAGFVAAMKRVENSL